MLQRLSLKITSLFGKVQLDMPLVILLFMVLPRLTLVFVILVLVHYSLSAKRRSCSHSLGQGMERSMFQVKLHLLLVTMRQVVVVYSVSSLERKRLPRTILVLVDSLLWVEQQNVLLLYHQQKQLISNLLVTQEQDLHRTGTLSELYQSLVFLQRSTDHIMLVRVFSGISIMLMREEYSVTMDLLLTSLIVEITVKLVVQSLILGLLITTPMWLSRPLKMK